MEAKVPFAKAVTGAVALFSGMVLFCYAFRGLFVKMLTLGDLLICLAAAALGAVGYVWPRAAASTRAEGEAIVRRALACLFAFYIACLVGMLFTCRIDGSMNLAQRREAYLAHWDTHINLTPLRTVRRYLSALSRGVIPITSLKNLIGNVLLLTPMAVLAPCLFESLRRPWRFILFTLFLLLAIEGLQLLLYVGICDVDDMILNFAGGLLTYLLLQIPLFQRGLTRLYLLPEAGAEQVDQECLPGKC